MDEKNNFIDIEKNNTKLSHKKPKLSPEELKKRRQIAYHIYQLKLRSRYLFNDDKINICDMK